MYVFQDAKVNFPHAVEVVVDSCENAEIWVRGFGTIWSTKFLSDRPPSHLIPGTTVLAVGRIGNRLIIR